MKNLKKSNLNLGFDKANSQLGLLDKPKTLEKDLKMRDQMFSYVQRRDFASNVLPLQSN